MPFEPKDESELRDEMCWPEGVYDFEVTGCQSTYSKSNNKMLALELKIFNGKGGERTVRDWLVENSHPLCLMKLRHYCHSVGAPEAYETGDIDNFPGHGACGKVEITVERSEEYGLQNKVRDYVKEDEERPVARGVPASQTKAALDRANAELQEGVEEDSEIPF